MVPSRGNTSTTGGRTPGFTWLGGLMMAWRITPAASNATSSLAAVATDGTATTAMAPTIAAADTDMVRDGMHHIFSPTSVRPCPV